VLKSDRGIFRRAIEISVLLHLLVIFLIAPRVSELWSASASSSPLVPVTPPEDKKPLNFEFVDLPEEHEERPRENRPAPLSDLDRRAHGGEGDPSQSVGVRGNTPQLVQSDGGLELRRGVPPQAPGTRSRQVPPPQPQQPEERPEPEPQRPTPAPDGAGEQQSPDRTSPNQQLLPPPGAWALPPDAGGLAKIRAHWRIPEIAQLGVQGVVRIRFYIERDGTMTGLAILNESGKPPMDFAARDAIGGAAPFDPLPSDLTGVDREGVTITFFYNTRPPNRNYE